MSTKDKFIFFVYIFLLLVFSSTKSVTAQISRVWAVDDSEKIMKQDIINPLRTDPNNKVWDGQKVNIVGAKNEIVAFQLILQSDASGVSNVNVIFDSLSSSNFSIDNSKAVNLNDPFNYVGKRIELFTESYINVDTRTHKCISGAWGYSGPQGNYLGWVPDALIPFQAPAGKGGAPFAIDANSNQGIWFDIYIPKEAPPGIYNGEINVTVNSENIARIPISLRVYDFTLPDETHLKNLFYFGGYESTFLNNYNLTYRSSAYFPVEGRYFQMAHRHRMNLTANVNYSQMVNGANPFKRYLVTGPDSYYKKTNGYEGPGEEVGNGAYILSKYNSFRAGFPLQSGSQYCNACGNNVPPADGVCNTKDWWQKQAACWVNWFSSNAPSTEYFLFMEPDEPKPSEYSAETNSFIQRLTWLTGTGLKRFVTMTGFPLGSEKTQANPYPLPFPYLTQNIDYWAVGAFTNYYHPPLSYWGGQYGMYMGYMRSYTDYLHSLGKKTLFYNGAYPWSGTTIIDADATHMRVNPWIIWKYKSDLYSYYHIHDYTRYDSSGAGEQYDPFVSNYKLYNAANFGNQCSSYGMVKYYGSGSLIYPGTNHYYPDTNLDLLGPIASIRMKNWRRGEQDYEYLYLAQQAGYETEVSNIVNQVVPRALYDRDESNHPGWPESGFSSPADWPTRGYVFENYRKQIADLITSNNSPTDVPTNTPVPIPGDANSDGKVDGIDYVIWLNHYNQNVGGISNGDFNNDSKVDGIDYVIWLNNYEN